MKTLSTVLREQNITKRADILKFIKTSELTNKVTGKKLNTEGVRFQWVDSNSNFRFDEISIYASDIYVAISGITIGGTSIENFNVKIEILDKQIKEIKEKKTQIQCKINFLKESGAKKFIENEFRAYQAIQTINKKGLTDFEKAKVISKLISK